MTLQTKSLILILQNDIRFKGTIQRYYQTFYFTRDKKESVLKKLHTLHTEMP